MNSNDKSYSICIRKLYQIFLPEPPTHFSKKDSHSKNYIKEDFYMTRNSDVTALHLNIFVMYSVNMFLFWNPTESQTKTLNPCYTTTQ